MIDALLTAIVSADEPGVIAALRGRSEADRQAAAKVVVPLTTQEHPYWQRVARTPGGGIEWGPELEIGDGPEDDQPLALQLAVLGTATFAELRRIGVWYFSLVDQDHAARVLLDRDPPWLAGFATWILRAETVFSRWRIVRALVREGAIERPPDVDYLGGMITAAREHTASKLLDDDPALEATEVWELLRFDGGADSLRAADDAGAGWADAIASRLDRDRLLDATLHGLAVGLSDYRAVWYTRLWKQLGVTPGERAARHDALRALLGTVTAFAVEELVKDKRPIPPQELAPALTAKPKKTVRAALKLLDRTPDAQAAALALGNPAADIQGEVLDRLERWDGAHDALLAHLDLLAATQRPRAEALLGLTGTPQPEAAAPAELPPLLGAPVEPLALDELVAALVPTIGDWQAPRDERLLDAILRHCDRKDVFDGPLRAHTERLRALSDWFGTVAHVAAAWLTGPAYTPGNYERTWEQRLDAAAQRAARGEAGPLLALPTHAGGWIDSATFIARLEQLGTPDEVELAQAILRLAPDGREEALAAAAPYLHAGAQAAAAAVRDPGHVRIEFRGRIDVALLAPEQIPPGPLGEHLRAVAVASERSGLWVDPNSWPQRRDLACAGAIARIGWNLEAGSANLTEVPGVLEVLLATGEPLSPSAHRLITLALCSIDDREHLLATDLLIAALAQGRIEPSALVEAIRPDLPLVITSRLAKRLEIAAAAGPRPRAAILEALEALDAALAPLPARRRNPLLRLRDELRAREHRVGD